MREVKAKLAKLLAEENIQIRHSSTAKTASFDVKQRILTLPVFKNMTETLYDLLTGHEVGHSLYTPCDGWETAITVDGVNKNILNIVEDPRIERKIKNRFPGLRKSFIDGYRELMDRGFFGADLDFSKMNVLDRINMHFKGGSSLGVPFDKSEQWMVRLVESTDTWDDAVEAAKIIQMAYSEMDDSEFNLDELMFGSGEASDSFENIPFDWDSTGDEGLDGDDTDNDGDDESESKEGELDASDFDSEQHDVADGEITTQEWYELRKNELNENDARDRHYFGLPKPIVKNLVIDHKTVRKELTAIIEKGFKKIVDDPDDVRYDIYYGRRGDAVPNKEFFQGDYNKFRSQSQKIINYMVKEFERKKAADEYKRTSVSKTGLLNVNALHAYKFEDDLFLKRAIVHDGKNHGLVMLLDWSASMSHHMENTIKQLLSLVWFCNKVNIPYEVYAFTSAWSDDSGDLYTNNEITKDEWEKRMVRYHSPNWTYKQGDAYFGGSNFQLLNIVSSRASVAEMNAQLFNLYVFGVSHRRYGHHAIEWKKYSLSSTPLVEAMVAMQYIVPNFRDHYKLDKVNFICMTDGEANSSIGAFYDDFKEDLDDKREYTMANNRAEWIFDDPMTRKQWNVHTNGGWRHYNGEEEYRWLVRLLKHRYGINTIGIFLDAGNRGLSRGVLEKYLGWLNYNREAHKKARRQCRLDGFATIQTAGYDEYYLIPMGSQQIEDDTSLPLDDGAASEMSKGKLRSIFAKNQKRKFGNRILTNRILDLIT